MVVVLLALVGIIAGALVFYSKKNEIWCFSSGQSDNTVEQDPEIQKALQDEGSNAAPIVKPGYRRPTDV